MLDRFGTLDPARIAAADPEEFAALCATPPAIHRFPGSMAARMQELAALVDEKYDGDATRMWTEADHRRRSCSAGSWSCPGFGKQKAQIFVALLAKQLDVRPAGWETVVGDYAEHGLPLGRGRRRRGVAAEGARLQEAEEGRCEGRMTRRRRSQGLPMAGGVERSPSSPWHNECSGS